MMLLITFEMTFDSLYAGITMHTLSFQFNGSFSSLEGTDLTFFTFFTFDWLGIIY